MDQPRRPWEISPSLRPEHLSFLDKKIREVRSELAELRLEEKGDDAWVIGCRAYSWTVTALKLASASGECPWLHVDGEGLQVSVRVELETIVLYRGNPDERPNARHVRRALRALEELAAAPKQLGLFGESCAGWMWMLAVDADEDGRVLRTGVLQIQGDEPKANVRNIYIIGDEVAAVASMSRTRKAVDLAAPEIGVPTETATTAVNDNGNGNDGNVD